MVNKSLKKRPKQKVNKASKNYVALSKFYDAIDNEVSLRYKKQSGVKLQELSGFDKINYYQPLRKRN